MTQEPLWQPSDILNAETEGDAESPKRRGRIPQSAWPRILERYRAGATLSAIAREFDCTPSAISYIVRKAEAAGLTAEGGEGDDVSPALPLAPEPAAPPAPAAAITEAPRAPRRAKAPVAEVRSVAQAEPVPVVEAPVTVAAPAPPPAAAERAPAPEPATPSASSGDVLQHDSGRSEARGDSGRRFEARENRPPRDREGREPREPRFADNNRADGNRSDNGRLDNGRPDNRGERGGSDRGDNRGQQDGRRQQGGVPRFPQGGQRFSGERPGRDRLEGRDNNRPPRDFDRNSGDRVQERLPAFDPTIGDQPSEVVYPYRQQQRNPARLEAQEAPTSPANERMDEAAKACAEAYLAWKSSEGGVQVLGDAIHELRKVIARMEIEISASRKEEQRPIPIPNYRQNQPPPQQPRG